MKQFVLILFTATYLFACNNNKQETAQKQQPAVITAADTGDSANIRNVILDFYTWYTGNYDKMMGYQLYKGINKMDQPPYKINWDEVKRYQAFIKDSVPQLGQDFLDNQMKMFRQCDSAFKVDMADEIPYGFDYDWYTNSQEEPSYLLTGIRSSGKWIISIKGDEASVEIGAPEDKNYVSGSLLLFVGLKKENGQWKIAKIGND